MTEPAAPLHWDHPDIGYAVERQRTWEEVADRTWAEVRDGFRDWRDVRDVYVTDVTIPLRPAVRGMPYSDQLRAAGGTAPYRFVLIDGELPEGLELNEATGVIAGVVPRWPSPPAEPVPPETAEPY